MATLTLDLLCSDLQETHENTNSWRKAGAKYGLNPATARMIANGYKPGKKLRDKLGLPVSAAVVVMYGEVPDGTQVICAYRCVICAKWFIPNHPRRKKCFECSPYGGKK